MEGEEKRMKHLLVIVLSMFLVGCGLSEHPTAQKNFCSITRYQANQDVMSATDADTIAKLRGCWEWSGKCLEACTNLDSACKQYHSTTVEACKIVGIPHDQDMGTDQR